MNSNTIISSELLFYNKENNDKNNNIINDNNNNNYNNGNDNDNDIESGDNNNIIYIDKKIENILKEKKDIAQHYRILALETYRILLIQYRCIQLIILILSSLITLIEAIRLTIINNINNKIINNNNILNNTIIRNNTYTLNNSYNNINIIISILILLLGTFITIFSGIIKFYDYHQRLENLRNAEIAFTKYNSKYVKLETLLILNKSEIDYIIKKINKYEDEISEYFHILLYIKLTKYYKIQKKTIKLKMEAREIAREDWRKRTNGLIDDELYKKRLNINREKIIAKEKANIIKFNKDLVNELTNYIIKKSNTITE